jgi:hypothetical protein
MLILLLQNATLMNITDACTLAVEGETDKFCQAAQENDLSDEIANPPFPVVLCHSPEDELIPYALSPNVSASENLTEFSLLGGITASGSHAEAGLFCFFSMVLPFTVFHTGPSAIEQVPLDTCADAPTQVPDGTPTQAPGTPPTEAPPTTMIPTSTAYRACLSFVAMTFSFVWSVIG